jgi:hypothetical protein
MNKDANYYSTVGGYRGAYRAKAGGQWIGVQMWNRRPDLLPRPLRRWQGPPSAAITEAMKKVGIGKE